MKREIILTSEPIDEPALVAGREISRGMGAVVHFLGFVRGEEDGKPIEGLRYEAFEAMAKHQFELLLNEIEKRWKLESVRLLHRTGIVPTNHPSLWVEVIAPHRAEAFAACQWLIDEMKRVVPIWKRAIRESASATSSG